MLEIRVAAFEDVPETEFTVMPARDPEREQARPRGTGRGAPPSAPASATSQVVALGEQRRPNDGSGRRHLTAPDALDLRCLRRRAVRPSLIRGSSCADPSEWREQRLQVPGIRVSVFPRCPRRSLTSMPRPTCFQCGRYV